jgi:hypothetical protein
LHNADTAIANIMPNRDSVTFFWQVGAFGLIKAIGAMTLLQITNCILSHPKKHYVLSLLLIFCVLMQKYGINIFKYYIYCVSLQKFY